VNNQFDELTEGPAQSVTRRAALKKFGIGLASRAAASQTPANEARRFAHPARNLRLATLKRETENRVTGLAFTT
jgi:hypothetical protein